MQPFGLLDGQDLKRYTTRAAARHLLPLRPEGQWGVKRTLLVRHRLTYPPIFVVDTRKTGDYCPIYVGVEVIGRKKGSSSLTQLELQLMETLWGKGPCTVQDVQTVLAETNPLAYTTVQTVLNTLERKGKAKRKLDGRAYVYEASISKDSILKQAIRDLAERMFSGSSEELVMSLLKIREVDPVRIAKLSKKLVEKSADD